MKILIFAGTTEGRIVSEKLAEQKKEHTVCVTSEYGSGLLHESGFCSVHTEKMDSGRMHDFIAEGGFDFVIDATHPYAYEASRNIKAAAEGLDIQCVRLKRDTGVNDAYEKMEFFDSNEDCAAKLLNTQGNILLTIGSRELHKYCVDEALKERLFVRIIPDEESLKCCTDLGIKGKNIVALQGPFSEEMNEAMIDMYDIAYVISKQSGAAGGFAEKLNAAKKKGITFCVIGCLEKEDGLSTEEVLARLGIRESAIQTEETETEMSADKTAEEKIQITLAGIGPGSRDSLTAEVMNAVKTADYLLGAERMLELFPETEVEKKPFYRPEEIIPFLKEKYNYKRSCEAVVLFSGDTGFYSGATRLYKELVTEAEKEGLNCIIRILPGISSVSCLAARCNVSYEDAKLISMHGKIVNNPSDIISQNEKTFVLLSGRQDVNLLGTKLTDAGLNDVLIKLGIRLSYEDERILSLSPKECKVFGENGLMTAFVYNPHAKAGVLTPGIPDDDFIRDKVPMTKQEVRALSICKLHLDKNSVLYDIGGGTGSVSVEAAKLSEGIQVFSVERKEEACELIEKNRAKFALDNLSVIHDTAPDGLDGLPVATHAFIGGSGGNLKEIIDTLYAINPRMRVVINAISIETVSELKSIITLPFITNTDIVLAQFSHAKNVLDYHLMLSDNPVWICSFDFTEKKDEN